MIWLVLFALSYVCGQEDIPRILIDASNFHGFPESFSSLIVQTNNAKGAKYHWLKDGKKITKESQPTFVSPFTTQLFIPNPGKDYAGIYQFVMTTPAGTIKGREIKVDFTYLGEFDSFLSADNTQDVVVGQANFIKCPKHTAGSNVIYKWGKSSGVSGTRFLEIKPNHIVLDNGTLFYSHLTEQNANHFNENGFTCGMEAKVKETNRFKWAEKIKTQFHVKDTNLTKFGPKIVTKLPDDKRFQEGHTIPMKCAAAGRPTPVYSWKRIDVYGTEFVVEDGKDGIKFEDGDARLLVIKTASRKHAGQYFCTATIGDKNDTVEGSLTFEVKPVWIGEIIQSVKPSIYSSHSWTCNATGFPMPTYEWHKDGNLLVSSEKHAIDGGALTFPSLEKTDTGMYECVADNGLDNIYQTAYLDVQAEKPVFDTNTGKTTLFLGAKGVIKCYAKAAPTAKNTWMKDGVAIDFSLSRYTLVNDEDLAIDSVSKQDIGNYTCKAKNQYGEDVKKIGVQVVGEITFVEEPQDVDTTRGKQIRLKCRAEGDKESPIKATIKYKWKYNGKDIELNDTIVWSDGAYALVFLKTTVSQSGDYECIAYIDQPSYAEKKRKATVVIRGPPEAPNTVKIDGDCSSFSAKLTWHITGSNYEPIKNFIIQIATSYDPVWRDVNKTVLPTEDEKTISGLSPWTQYRFRVLAINEIGTSAPSEPTKLENCKTPSKAPAKCPKINAIPGKENQLTLKWEKIELIDQNGEDFGYRLVYSSSKPKFSETKTFKPHELEFSIPNAGYYRPWSFKIEGYNKVGGGPFCEGTSYSGQNAPTMPPADLRVKEFGDVYLVLQWNEISLKQGSVDGYKLTYNQNTKSKISRRSISAQNCDEKNPCVKDIIGSDTTIKRLDGLIPYTSYRIAVRGYNSGGMGPESSMSVSTKEAKPGPPVQKRVISYAKFIKLEWSKPHRPNGIVIGYNVSIDKDAKPRFALVDGTTREYVFGGLVPKKAYVVHIQAKTAKGFGEKLIVRAKTTSPQIPAKPGLPVLKGFGQDGVNVTFRDGKPEDARGYPERFVVVYRVKGGKDDTWIRTDPVSSSELYVAIRGLDKNKEYEMATIAVNDEGESNTSDVQTVRPGDGEESAPISQSNPIYKRSWFVAIVVIVCFLLIVLLIALLITRKRGERYPVGKREKKRAGILDVGEEPDLGSYPLKPPRQNGNGVNRQNSGRSVSDRDPDRDSLDEYGEDRFDEDAASLIGAYNDDRKHNKTVEEPEFV